MSSSALYNNVFQAKISNVQNAADTSAVYSAGVWSFKNSTALTSVTITDAGNVGVGVTTPASYYLPNLVVNSAGNTGISIIGGASSIGALSFGKGTGVNVGDNSNRGKIWYDFSGDSLNFSTAGSLLSPSMRIDASGNLLVGTASSSRRLHVTKSDATNLGTAVFENPNAGNSGVGALVTSIGSGNGTQGNTNCWHLKSVTEGINAYYLYGNGTSSFTSDQRLKKNIESARNGYVEDLCKLRVVKYHWNTSEDSEAKELGLIAQEVEQVFPGLVQEADVEFEGGLKPKVLKGSVLPFMLLKAIQELSAKVDAQAEEIKALKAQP